MAEGYCVKCKAKKPISNAVEEIMKNGRKAINRKRRVGRSVNVRKI